MKKEHEEIIIESLKDVYFLREKFSDFEINTNFQVLLAQLDLFKLMASLVVGVIGIGYLYSTKLDVVFLLISLSFALLTLVISISYTRERIDLQPKKNEQTHRWFNERIEKHAEIVTESLKSDDSNIFFDYARKGLDIRKDESLNWIGEILVLFFYLSIGFLVLSFFSYKYNFSFVSYQTVTLLLAVYMLSFKKWAILLSEKLSIPCRNLFRIHISKNTS